MARSYKPIIVFVFTIVFVVACVPAPTPTPLPSTAVLTVPTVSPTVTDGLLAPTAMPTAVPPTPTKMPTLVLPTAALPTETFPERTDSMKIRITLEDTVITATLADSQTARDFMSLLPLTLTLEDYAGTEKISYLPQKLSTEDAPAGSNPSVGDITYYAPWGNLAIFYKDFGYASGLVILGKIDGGIEALSVPGSVNVTIELIE